MDCFREGGVYRSDLIESAVVLIFVIWLCTVFVLIWYFIVPKIGCWFCFRFAFGLVFRVFCIISRRRFYLVFQ